MNALRLSFVALGASPSYHDQPAMSDRIESIRRNIRHYLGRGHSSALHDYLDELPEEDPQSPVRFTTDSALTLQEYSRAIGKLLTNLAAVQAQKRARDEYAHGVGRAGVTVTSEDANRAAFDFMTALEASLSHSHMDPESLARITDLLTQFYESAAPQSEAVNAGSRE